MRPQTRNTGSDRWGNLLSAAQAGDKWAYGDLLRELLPVLRRIVTARMGRDEAEDVVQEILISLHTARHSYQQGRPFLPWLMAIARYGIADHLQRKSRNRRLEAAVMELADDAVPAGFDLRLEDREFLGKGLASLPISQRMALEMTKLRQLTLEEAAFESGMSITALKVAVHRGIHTLRRNWTAEEAGAA